MELSSEYGKVLLRISLSLVFLWFGANQIYSPANWESFVPSFLSSMIQAKTIIFINGSFEILFGLMMLSGFYLRISAFLLSLHLMGIAISLGYNAIAIRDFGLSLATLSVSIMGSDKFCLDEKFKETRNQKV
ncbi:MAG: DoxX family membrane protein [Nanoarchaeota archaeon]